MNQSIAPIVPVSIPSGNFQLSFLILRGKKPRQSKKYADPVQVNPALVAINKKNMNWNNLNILISGGSSGIGLEIARKLANRGSNITILARNEKNLQNAVSLIKDKTISQAQNIKWISADVSNYSVLEQAFINHGENFDCLINSAGLAYPGKFSDLSVEIHKKLMDVNYLGTVNLSKLVLPYMISKKSGYIVNISSLAGLVGIYGYTSYASTKYAIRGFSSCLRSELKPLGINVSVVYPPDTDTPQLSFERSIMPDITRKINSGGGVMKADKVALAIIKGIENKKFTIVPGLEGKILYTLAPLIDLFLFHYAVYLARKENN